VRCGQGAVRMNDNEEERSIDNLNLQLKLEKRTNMPSSAHSPHLSTSQNDRRTQCQATQPLLLPLASPLLLEVDKARHILHPPQPRTDGTQGFGHELRRSSYGLGQEHGGHAGMMNPCARPPAR